MIMMAMLSHVSRVRGCEIESPTEINDMMWEEIEAIFPPGHQPKNLKNLDEWDGPSILHGIGRPGYYE